MTIPERTKLLGRFFKGESLAQRQEAIEALLWYRKVAQNALARYADQGYKGPGIATQTNRLLMIADQLRAWGVE